MMRYLKFSSILLIAVLVCSSPQHSQAQSLEIVAGNALYGAATGAVVGTGTMLLANSNNTRPLTVGIGLGTLGGVAAGIYDMTTLDSDMRVHGLLHSAPTSGAIIFIDTLYGVATGSLVGVSIALIGNSPLVDGLQYGAGVGAYAGFAFGLLDAFYLGDIRTNDNDDFFDISHAAPASSTDGFLTFYSNNQTSISSLKPVVYDQSVVAPNGSIQLMDTNIGIEMLKFSRSF